MSTPSHAAAPYLRIADDLERRITSGEFRVGERVPSTRQITRDWGVAIATATKALGELRARGLVHGMPGLGTVVAGSHARTDATVPTPTTAVTRTTGGAHTTAANHANGRTHTTGGTHRTRDPRPSQTAPLASAPVPVGGSDRTDAVRVRRGGGRRTGTADGADMRSRIIRTAIGIADSEGLPAVSMRRIAIELDVATMSLYRWIPSKDDLLDGMLDGVIGDADWPQPPPGWRAQLEVVAHRQWASYRAHPWLARVVSLTRPQLAPGAMMHTEWALRAVSDQGLDHSTMLLVALTLFGHVRGVALDLDAEAQAEQDTGMDSEEWIRTRDAAFTPVIASGRYPTLAQLDGEPDIDVDVDRRFEFGLRLLLDGLAKVIEDARRR